MGSIVVKKWFARKATYGTSRTAHIILFNEATKSSALLCRAENGGQYAFGTLVELKEQPKKQDICPACLAQNPPEVLASFIEKMEASADAVEFKKEAEERLQYSLYEEREANRKANAEE